MKEYEGTRTETNIRQEMWELLNEIERKLDENDEKSTN